MATIRHAEVTNNTNAAVVSDSAIVNQGQDYALECVTRIFTADDIADEDGGTRDPVNGMIFAEFESSTLKSVLAATLKRALPDGQFPAAGVFEECPVYGIFLNPTSAIVDIKFKIVNSIFGSTLIMFDASPDAETQIQAGDKITVLLEFGNS